MREREREENDQMEGGRRKEGEEMGEKGAQLKAFRVARGEEEKMMRCRFP